MFPTLFNGKTNAFSTHTFNVFNVDVAILQDRIKKTTCYPQSIRCICPLALHCRRIWRDGTVHVCRVRHQQLLREIREMSMIVTIRHHRRRPWSRGWMATVVSRRRCQGGVPMGIGGMVAARHTVWMGVNPGIVAVGEVVHELLHCRVNNVSGKQEFE
uniref:Peptidase_M1 domain-containing protein n=1 Tax=Panagrellus redivivus TaxID=6233 RepID=A0A7E4UQT7_PANRE